jgi:hypothetical protein
LARVDRGVKGEWFTLSHRGTGQSTISSSLSHVTSKCRGALRAGEGEYVQRWWSKICHFLVLVVHVSFETSVLHLSATDFTLLHHRFSEQVIHRLAAESAVVRSDPVRRPFEVRTRCHGHCLDRVHFQAPVAAKSSRNWLRSD